MGNKAHPYKLGVTLSLGFAAFFLHFITKAARWFDYVAERRKNLSPLDPQGF